VQRIAGGGAPLTTVLTDTPEARAERLAWQRTDDLKLHDRDHSVRQEEIDTVCAVLPAEDALFVGVLGDSGKLVGHGMKHLMHFLGGSGSDLQVDLKALFADNPNLYGDLCVGIASAIDSMHETSGTLDYTDAQYSSEDWLDAIGAPVFDWKLVGDQITISLLKKYIWHPDELRQTQCLHQAAQKLVDKGVAKEFWMVGQLAVSKKSVEATAW